MSQSHIIFDLDGTLIDSAPSILYAFEKVLHDFAYEPLKPLESKIIGPPLRQTLQEISGESDSKKLNRLVDAFKDRYDNSTCTLSKVYPGINQTLSALVNQGKRLYIATNKRMIPTRKIIDHFSWNDLFQDIYAIDSANPAFQNKAHMIQSLMGDLGLQIKTCVYVGDRIEDAHAASENAITFIYAQWGYGPKILDLNGCPGAKQPIDLVSIIKS